VSRAQDYLAKAAEVARKADAVRDDDIRSILLRVATAWRALAVHASRYDPALVAPENAFIPSEPSERASPEADEPGAEPLANVDQEGVPDRGAPRH
jgi:hypothetical protein